MRGGVLSRRLRKTLPPYVVCYAVLLRHAGAFGVLRAVLTGGAAAQMYFLFVYAQLVVLTPLIYRGLRRCPAAVYMVTPLVLVAYEAVVASGISVPHVGRLFPMWMLFYVIGLDRARWKDLVQGKFGLLLATLLGCICLQLASGFLWNYCGNYNMATTQLKLSSMATSLAVIALIMALPAHLKAKAGGSFLGKLGDASFGIFLCHMFAVAALGKVLGLVALPLTAFAALKWLLAVAASYVFCVLGGRVLPKKFAGWLGL